MLRSPYHEPEWLVSLTAVSTQKEYTPGAIVILLWIYDPWTQKNDSHWGWLWQLAAALFCDDLWSRPEEGFEDQKDHSHWALEMVKMSLEVRSWCRQTGPLKNFGRIQVGARLESHHIFKKMKIIPVLGLVLATISNVCGLHFYLDSDEERCFVEELPSGTIVEGWSYLNIRNLYAYQGIHRYLQSTCMVCWGTEVYSKSWDWHEHRSPCAWHSFHWPTTC